MASAEMRKKFKVALKRFQNRKRKVEEVTKMLTSYANPHFDWKKEITEIVDLTHKVHKKKPVEEAEELEQKLLSSTPSFVPCGYIYPVGADDKLSVGSMEHIQTTASDLSGYRSRAPTPQSGSGTSAGSAWLY